MPSSSSHPIHQATTVSPFGNLTADEFYKQNNLLHDETFFFTRLHKTKLFTQSWRPAISPSPLLGLVAMVHGYSSESGWIFALTAAAIARQGFLVFALDLPGHGRSSGRRGFIPNITPVLDDCAEFFSYVLQNNSGIPAFLYGESLGGAIALLLALRQRGKWNGLILNGAMCGVSSKVKPPWPLELFLPAAALMLPNLRLHLFTKSLVSKSYKLKWKQELVRNNPRALPEHPKAATALELLRVCEVVSRRCSEVELPLLVLHGKKDDVCDVESAVKAFAAAASKDKMLKIVPGMCHQLIGENHENVELGFGVIFSWLKERTMKGK